MLGFDALSSTALGAAEDELLAASAGPITPGVARAFKRAWACAFRTFGTDIIFRRDAPTGPPIRINTKAFFRQLMDREIVGTIMVSDVNILIDPAPLIAAGILWPTRQGDKVIRNKGRTNETLFTTVAPPVHLDVAGEEIVIRMIARGL